MPLKYMLTEEQIPRFWYNIIPDLPSPPAPMHPLGHASMAKLPKVG